MTDDHEMRDGCKVMFDGIGKSLDGLRTEAKAREGAAEDRHARVMRILTGHPDDGNKPGLVGRIDRIEQKDKARVWWFRAMAGTILGVIGKLIHGWHSS